jgi:hypothetical protein
MVEGATRICREAPNTALLRILLLAYVNTGCSIPDRLIFLGPDLVVVAAPGTASAAHLARGSRDCFRGSPHAPPASEPSRPPSLMALLAVRLLASRQGARGRGLAVEPEGCWASRQSRGWLDQA